MALPTIVMVYDRRLISLLMKFLYPRSFPRLLVVGFTLVALPLVFALVNNAISVDQLANRSQNAVYQAVQATQSGRRLAQMLTTLERTARQLVILDDRALLDSYILSRRRFEQAVADAAALPFDEDQKSELDQIVQGYVEENLGVNDLIARGFPADVVRRVVAMVDVNETKRRQAPIGVKITPRAFGKDWRLPIVNRFRE